ncbi:MAG: C_GCAxxG_C_C family protein [Clostridia bacterium]|nr:C_GCAxxG_C_C family protein [Clostridia bacterium]MBQ8658008.1 C_GCAxxG_C_C family protein [Clostridia bacterium]
MSRAEKAKEYFETGYTCSQAVALAFEKECGLDREALLKITLPFGGGLGRLRLTCGAVSGLAVVYGLICAKAELSPENKKQTYAAIQELTARFKAENGSLICNDLLTGANLSFGVGGEAENRTSEYYKKRPCGELVYAAAKILEEYLAEKGIIK